jgi:large subunit ribosomal protein L25
VRLPIQFVGEAPGVKVHDGVLLHQVEALNVEALPGDLPHHIEIDVSVLEELDQSLHVRDLVIPDKLTVLDDLDELIVKVQPPRKIEEEAVAEEEEAAAEGAAPAEEGEAVQPTAEAEPVEEKPQE